ncbi:MAG: Protein TolQ [Candidatus Tokpelaia hoelldobleri]|uniref:Tol-Pal system protein TolQ n=1 Tax=Candidatus Tokpelaia hoelldobleri TaxID=1902579 RepID=A0A1U9JSZ9_9HYPH|nr:MAG: Protein TolQ [Candidatus Tokpelaia hoelldoblerii]
MSADTTLLGLFWQANMIVKLVMIGLLAASLWSWAIIFNKIVSYGAARRSARQFEQLFWSGQSLEDLYRNMDERRSTGMSAIFMAAMQEWKKSFEKGARSPIGLQMRIDKAMDVALARETDRMEAQLGFLATVGSAAPFVGLFGTVVGIMTSFMSIASSNDTSLTTVAPGIAEALFATAIGLLAAIPAVVAYNKLSGDANKIGAQLTGFADEFSSILSRQIDERLAVARAK